MQHHANTLKALSDITDAGLFERLATAVLRESNPLYESLIHTGTNTSGQTVKSPIDGITFVSGANPPHMICVHHTTGDRDELEKKLLQDSSKIKSKKNIIYPDGDILKTIKLHKEERLKQPTLKTTLILTFTSEPSQEVIRKSEEIATLYGIEIDFWSASRIAHFLDTNPNGQYIRKQYLNITQERISSKLLLELSKKSIDNFNIYNQDSWIERNLDKQLKVLEKSGLTIVSGESGNGKTIACYKYLTQHIQNGGYGFILRDEILAQSQTLEEAIRKTLLNLHPSLTDACGYDILQIATIDKPIVLVLEDINTSGKAKLLLEKIISWNEQQQNSNIFLWKILCPIYPKFVGELDKNIVKKINNQLIRCLEFSKKEGIRAVERKHELLSKKITPLEAEKISLTLGNDPLLISLYDIDKNLPSSEIIRGFINNKITNLAQSHSEFMSSDYLTSLLSLIFKLLLNYTVKPKWSDIGVLNLSNEEKTMLRHLAHQGDIFRLSGTIEEQIIIFRHDRVYNWLASKAIAKFINTIELNNSFLKEPYLAEIIGLSLNEDTITDEIIEFIKLHNPLALFYSLQMFSNANTNIEKNILSAIFDWLIDEKTHSRSNKNLRWECIYCLSQTDSPHVLEILQQFKNYSHNDIYNRAGFRNGDFDKGITLCQFTHPGVNYIAHEQLMEYMITKYREELIAFVIERLNLNLSSNFVFAYSERIGILRMCGYLADDRLFDVLKKSWEYENEKSELLGDYFWACSHCCGNNASVLLEPIFNMWASLSDKEKTEGMGTPRNSFASHEIHWAFKKYVPKNAIDYFIEQTQREELTWPITYMLHGIDHPNVVNYMAHYFAQKEEELEGSDYYSPFLSSSSDVWKRDNKAMSESSKAELYKLWSNKNLNKYIRLQSFKLWSPTYLENDKELLIDFQHDTVLYDAILRQRIEQKDITAIPLFIEKIRNSKNSGYWWQFARDFWTSDLSKLLDEELDKKSYDEIMNIEDFSVSMISELIIKMNINEAELILLKHWDKIKKSPSFIQTSLYIASDKLIKLVAETINSSSSPDAFFIHLSNHYGMMTKNHKGITNIKQLEVLIPYLGYIKEMELNFMAYECNKKGYFEFRKKYLDIYLKDEKYKNTQYSSEKEIIKTLNEKLNETHFWYLEHWVDLVLDTGISKADFMNIVFKWIKSQNNIDLKMINIVLMILIHIESWNHYFELLKVCEGIKDKYIEEFENALFFIQRRELNFRVK
ncbi:hypothetical protein [Aliarcobacter butzleri]|uniref:ATP-binding protein n=1 Tax=Aliarcobacter butzleri TaxID=28197 RepID=A0AAW7PSU9_9BACT|nr:hypothetical protein [Aliarcobacter butzleri]MDN5063984.1 hypothetical protein [Aliarcobacter butzleri]MDN5065218.1 hypothetical protein [Aliarcobacter butzleri]